MALFDEKYRIVRASGQNLTSGKRKRRKVRRRLRFPLVSFAESKELPKGVEQCVSAAAAVRFFCQRRDGSV